MNACQARPLAAAPPADADAREHGEDPLCRTAFDRVLRGKSQQRDEEGRDSDAPPSLAALPMPARTPDVVAPALPAGIEPVRHAVLDAIGATLASIPEPAAEASWDVSLHEPLGVAVELRATRVNAMGWTLTVAAPELDAGTLARHAPRLADRLRTRTRAATHLRIAEDKEAP
ncbi:MAG TPA: hypothetical protein VF169_21915 [Albitalea sp.]|uniref:hypothetical protein n=1 Tax=Piscinibacter sp. TaxID=1903157 RepID=UPI002ED421AC